MTLPNSFPPYDDEAAKMVDLFRDECNNWRKGPVVENTRVLCRISLEESGDTFVEYYVPENLADEVIAQSAMSAVIAAIRGKSGG